MLNAIHHVAIIVSNYEISRKFYVELLELPIIRENYRKDKNDYKLDLQLGNIELEIFGVVSQTTSPLGLFVSPEKPLSKPKFCTRIVSSFSSRFKTLSQRGIQIVSGTSWSFSIL